MHLLLLTGAILIHSSLSNPTVSSSLEPEVFTKDELTLLLMGDPQYHFMCELSNPPCREASRRCREAAMKPHNPREKPVSSHSHQPTESDCVTIESRYANRIQRKAMESLIARQRYPPAALIIDGDLTDFGHSPQLEEFKSGWMKSFPIPILPGLGNHDYQNNVNDCALNVCARNMLNWFISYAVNKSIPIEFNATSYTGSLAYSKKVCSLTGKNCAQVIQLNNAIDYEVHFTAFLLEKWKIYSGLAYLKRQLYLLRDMDMPILINVHQNEDVREEKLKQLLGDWIYETRSYGIRRRVGVFFAHMHAKHEVKTHCFHGVSVPFVYVGSVPNNRFSVLRFGTDTERLSGYAARENGSFLLDTIPSLWQSPCNRSFVHYFQEQTSFRRVSL